MCDYIKKEEADETLRKKVKNFLDKVETFRKEQEYMPLNEFIWKIYLDTGYYSYVSLMPNGILRVSNLKMLFERAREYEKTSFKGLYNFISFIDKLKLSSKDMSGAKLIGENEDVIRIMSIHKSKGLEFPVVFLCGMAKEFNMRDLNQDIILLHQDLGLGPKYINYEEGESYATLAREAIKIKSKQEIISEEMRVLYVALTRAKEKLVITGIDKDYKKNIAQKEEFINSYNSLEGKINKNIIQKYISYLDWMELVYLKRAKELEEILEVNIHKKQDVLEKVIVEREKKEIDLSEKLEKVENKQKDKIKESLEWEYKYKIPKNILTKTSVTKIKNMKQGIEEEHKIEYKMPEFLKEEKKALTSAEKGSLMHLILQKLDEKVEYNEEKLLALANELEQRGIISKIEKEALDTKKILEFTKSLIWQEMKEAKEVHKEQAFYINIKAEEIYEEKIEEDILVQGIIDLYYIKANGEIVLVDYKTDKVKAKEELKEKYKEQLKIYKQALEKSLGRKLTKVYIYSIYLGEILEINT